ncbi:putative Tfp pilus assembly protein [Azoarcus olearius]|uniref:pilus assembly protein n=1 Tax=Azoarcus sp. (strain BH72) TaxID=418699 RepID=UPI0008062FD3|nr:PilC/PilY family type IV pilus protein [Azoarcus olearius]ANQ86085.1 putative Tfp pilus assembly protein [Azoarcus olearius]
MNFPRPLAALALTLAAATLPASAGIALPEAPLITSQAATPLSMLVVGRDHTLYYEAYNDASDIDGDGTLDTRFKPAITYYGLFDSQVCYSYSGNGASAVFEPQAAADSLGRCKHKRWSGNWLNYVTTSRIDALRKVFYGGYREVDTATETILRRAYIPQDAHSWAKEYTSEAVDGYKISDYTPLDEPTASRRHFFGNLTATVGVNCATLSSCSDLPPLLRFIKNSDRRVWAWASTERPVLHATSHGGQSRTDYTVRVKVCTEDFPTGCKRYPAGNLKPTGLLHEYGEGDAMFFGLLTGSYNKNTSGGVLRKAVSSFKSEIDGNNGVFRSNATIVRALDSLRIRDFNNGRSDDTYRSGWVTTRAMNEGEFVDWGNPVGEMMYETLRYFAGKKSATSAFATSGGYDAQVGLDVASWDDPYEAGSAASARWCARPSMLVVSGINPSFDSDQVPGSAFSAFSGTLGSLNVADIAQEITAHEAGIAGQRFIGQVGTTYDGAPTAKTVTTLGNIRGLAPDEPTKQGSYYSASVAHYGKSHSVRSDLNGSQTVDTYAVVLSSPLPRIEAKTTSGKTITLVPFAKSVGGSSISNTKGAFQPTNQIVDFYVDTIVNSSPHDAAPSVNGGRYFARFRINFEDVEQGADHDMDAIVVYEVAAEANGQLRVKLTPEYQAGGIQHSMGYVISGSDSDGVYLVVQDENIDRTYYLNVPPGQAPGYCDTDSPPAACSKLPYTGGTGAMGYSERLFSPGASTASLLKDPLWYAAKWGGFIDRNGNNRPDLPLEWDADGDGVPDTYFLVQNPLKLRESLKRSFDSIVERSASAGNVTSNGQQLQTTSRVFQSQFNSGTWDGELLAYPITASGVGATPSWRASAELPSSGTRNILTWKNAVTRGIRFEWNQLSATQQTLLGSESVLDYLRGNQSQEVQNAGTLRTRTKLLGDMVHSSPYYVKDTDTVYIGANDGMLHAFNAASGVELFAYIPNLVFGKLASLSSPGYAHTYFVDGDIAVSSRTLTPGRNLLVATAGRGAKGLFALDVTSPGSMAPTAVLWEYGATTDDDLGYMIGRPQLAKLRTGHTVALVGNGYNSVNGRAVLYVFDLASGALLKKLDTEVGGDNAMSTPTAVDTDGDGYTDWVYAGDIKGNVWKFDFSGNAPATWKSAYRSGSTPLPLFSARDASNNAQPITAQLTVAQNTVTSDANYGKTFVFFGTGSYVYSSDPNNMSVQSWYGLIDDGAPISGRGALRQRSIEVLGVVAGFPVRAFSAATTGDMDGMQGWFVDLKDPTARGERIVTRSNLYRFVEPVLIASSLIPDPDPCQAGGSGYINAINPFNGARLLYPPFDLNGDGRFDAADKLDNVVIGSFDPSVGMPGEATIVGDRLIVGGSSGRIADMRVNTGVKRTGRLSWREIIKD